MAADGWFPGWYVTRLHFGPAAGKAVCGAPTSVPRTDWQAKRATKDLPKCKKCLKQVSALEDGSGAERFLVHCEVEVRAASPEEAAAALRRHLPQSWPLAAELKVRDSIGRTYEIDLGEEGLGDDAART